MKILLVEDQLSTSLIIQTQLESWGYTVVCAQHGQEAWNILQDAPYPIVLTDWLMPVMDGLELCRKIRGKDSSNYTYVILGTAKNSQEDLVNGLEAGADDFIPKPYNSAELHIKLRNAERIMGYETMLTEKNTQLQEAMSLIQQDLGQAAQVQESLLPKEPGSILGIGADWLFLPSNQVGGDIFNIIPIDQCHLVFYLVDVVGHGIGAAMEAMSISKFLTPKYLHYQLASASSIAKEMNEIFQSTTTVMQCFTMALGILNTKTNKLRMVHAGHPPSLLIHQDGTNQLIEGGGLPLGILDDPDYDDTVIDLEKGDRLYLYSDGVLECENSQGEYYGLNRFRQLMEGTQDQPLSQSLTSLHRTVKNWGNQESFEDDVTVLAIECVQDLHMKETHGRLCRDEEVQTRM